MRSKRKKDHINIAARLEDSPFTTGFEDVQLIHDSVPELDFDDIDTKIELFGKTLDYPIIINAMTGGIEEALEFNRSLAEVSLHLNIAMAVGSQLIGLENQHSDQSFSIVRKVNPHGILLANIAANATPSQALQAIEMIGADALQVHLNIPQELAMQEGDRKFYGMLDNVAELVSKASVPVIAKEVGFGISREACRQLYDMGVRYFDVGGRGGTNFIAIEEARHSLLGDEFVSWGIPTAVSIAEVCSLDLSKGIIASGGIKNGLEAAKSIALGADLVGVAGILLKAWMAGGQDSIAQEMERFQYQLRCAMLMSGASNLKALQHKPLVVQGSTAQWLSARGVDINSLAQRSFSYSPNI